MKGVLHFAFHVTDPLGNIPIFLSSHKAVTQARHSRLILREVLIAFGGPLAIPASPHVSMLLPVSWAPKRQIEWVAALSVTMIVCTVVLLSAERLQRVVGERVINAFERLMGLVLVSISVEMMIRGIKTLGRSWPA